MKLLIGLCLLATLAWAVDPSRVMVIVNDSMPAETGTGGQGASIYVGNYYANARGIPNGNVLHITMRTNECYWHDGNNGMTPATFQSELLDPILAALNANSGLLKKQILYIVPVYGIPWSYGYCGVGASVDGIISALYNPVDFQSSTGFVNTYYQNTDTGNVGHIGHRPPHFDVWADALDLAGTWRPYIVSRLDGPTAMIAKGLVDKAIAGESSVNTSTMGKVYYDFRNLNTGDDYQVIDHLLVDGNAATAALPFPPGTSVFHNQGSGGVSGDKPLSTPLQFMAGWYYYAYKGWLPWSAGAVGAVMTSLTGNLLRTPWDAVDPDPAGNTIRWNGAWVPRMLEEGITATWGPTSEPCPFGCGAMIVGSIVIDKMLAGYNFGEAYFSSNPQNRWMFYAVGDPLYSPMGVVTPRSTAARQVSGRGLIVR